MTNDKVFRYKVAAGMAAIIAVLLALAYAGYNMAREQRVNLALVRHTYEVKSQIEDLLDASRNAATGQRGYVVLGSQTSLALFEHSNEAIPQLLAKLRLLVRDNPSQVVRADELAGLFDERFSEALSVISRRRAGDEDGAYNQLLTGRTLALSEAISQQTKIMEDQEDDLLSQRLLQTAETARRTEYISIGGAAFAILGILVAVFAVFRDLRRRLSVEQALRDSSALLQNTLGMQRAVVNSANYAIIATDPDGFITDFNPAAERMLGYKAAEVIGKVNPGIFHVHGEVVAAAEKFSQELGRTVQPSFEFFATKTLQGKMQTGEWTFIRKDGSTFPAELSVSLVRNSEGEVLGFLGIASDITERKNVERLKNEFISTVSHELRTPLTSIRGSLGLVLGGIAGEVTAQGKSLLDIAHKNAERLGRLINDILDIEKIESGKMEFQMKRQPLAPLLRQSIESTADYGRQHDVSFHLADEAPGVEVEVDSDRFMQVMANLLSNAAKFSPEGGTVEVTAVLVGKAVRISVADKGKGIPAEFRDRIFQKFAQADSSDTRQKGGTGLGLSITKAMMEHMGGSVGFDSVVDRGTTFFVDLPTLSAVPAVPAEARAQAGVGSRPRVLVCEDDADIALLLRMMLDQGGFDCDIVASAGGAQRKLATDGPYLALTLDIALPDKTGLELFHELRAASETQDLPIIFVSAEADKGRRALNGAAVGVLDWLQKPIDPQRLLHAVRMARHQSRQGAASVLHVEDDPDLIHVVTSIIEPIAKIDSAPTLAAARAKLAEGARYDLVLLDLTLPDGDGAELLSAIPAEVPVVIFSAREVPEELARKVSSALTKSKTSNELLLHSITAIIDKMAAPRVS
ncbi:MAG TPA: response regulator [Alphaproteobacteria bacterium]|jgi:PAS domain S-box-containing protein